MGLLLCGFLLSAISAQAQDSDDGQIPLRVEILAPDDNCQLLLGSEGSIGFGQLAQPTGTGTAGRTLDPVSATGGSAGTTLAEMILLTSAPRAFTLTVSAPADLARTGGTGLIDYALLWAERASDGDPYEGVPTTSYSGSTGDDGEHAFRFGGTISGIDAATAPGVYAAQMNVSVTCN
ncbi:MAG: hypothetical protein ACE5G0_09285 [Rhodothermales bacterium]